MLKCNTGGRQSLSSGRSARPVSQGAGAAGAFAAGRAYRRRTPPPRRKIPPGPTPGLAGAARRLSMSCDPGTRTGAARRRPGAVVRQPQVPVQHSSGLPVVPHVLVDPLVADPALKAQSPRDLDSTAEPAFPRLRATAPGLSSGTVPRCGARSPAGGPDSSHPGPRYGSGRSSRGRSRAAPRFWRSSLFFRAWQRSRSVR